LPALVSESLVPESKMLLKKSRKCENSSVGFAVLASFEQTAAFPAEHRKHSSTAISELSILKKQSPPSG
jgi:hypothetical protein